MAKASTLSNMVITLLLITFIASAVLGTVFVLTEEPIEKARAAKINTAIAEVVPAFNNSPSAKPDTIEIDGRQICLFTAMQDSTVVGIAVETVTSRGFGGIIKLMVGFLPDGTIYNTAVLEHTETPGLGDKIKKSTGGKIQLWKHFFKNMRSDEQDFATQFNGKNPETFKLAVTKDRGDVDAITAATISSRAFCDAVERAHKAFKKLKEE